MPDKNVWSGFYKKALRERQNQLALAFPNLFKNSSKEPFPIKGLDEQLANNMIENCIGTIGLPVGLGLNFVINGESLIIPMVIEEPSVVAAVSGAAKTICGFQGFQTRCSERNTVISQVQLLDIPDSMIEHVIQKLNDDKDNIISLANTFCPSMVARGGGVINMHVRSFKKSSAFNAPESFMKLTDSKKNSRWLIIHLIIDVCDAMGANAASTVAEQVAPYLSKLTGARAGVRIVSNYTVERRSVSQFEIPVDQLSYKSFIGLEIAARILEISQWVEDDSYRAITHNKGVMNGIDAVSIAVGQDWRAIEAAAHVWASRAGQESYKPLTEYWVEERIDAGKDTRAFYVCGKLDMPIAVGTKGGVLGTNPVYSYNLGLMGNPDSKTLSQILVSVGLAQNFAALRALVSEGIQRGHMNLHASNIAIAAGAPSHAITECVEYMIENKRISYPLRLNT